ncbi:MAG: Trm112 family protein [Pikeienuella sp.]
MSEITDHSNASRSGVDRKMLECLVCPVTQGTLKYNAETNELISVAANLAYPIRDGIPIMLADEARELD